MLKHRRRAAFHALAALTVMGLWMLTQPYCGLRHDAVLYLAQTVRTFRPAQFGHDLFFAYGSQDSFSVYSLIFGPVFARAEVWPVQPIVVALSHAAFLAAVWRLLPRRLSLRERWLSMAAIALLRPAYGGLSIFGICEPFLTARTLAEPLALWALVLARRDQVWRAWLLLLLAAALHPLMALPAAASLWLLCCMRDRRWLLMLLLLLLPAALLVIRHVPPFDGLLREYPADWWRIVAKANEQVLVRNWLPSDWASICVDVLTLLGARQLLYRDKRFVVVVLAACLFLLALAVLGSQLYRNELLTQLQLWRSLWLVRTLAVALTPPLLLAIARKGPAGPATAGSVACVIGMANLHWPATWLALVWPLLHLWVWQTRQPVGLRVLRLSLATSALALLIIGGADYIGLRMTPAEDANYLDFSAAGIALAVLPLPALAALTWLWRARRRPGRVGPAWAAGMAALAFAAAITGAAQWDRRTPLSRYMESHLHSTHPFEALVPSDAQVYWDSNLGAAWFLLKRSSYFAPSQGAGLLFNERTAQVWQSRSNAFQPIVQRRTSCEFFTIMLGKLPVGSPPCLSLPEDEVQAVCRAIPELAFVVAPQRYGVPPLATWEIPQDPDHKQTQYLYACSSFRQGAR